tara:strand:+ start:85 stop:459 length:375 start_codon:yes stop_codon:yes gene_type:complete
MNIKKVENISAIVMIVAFFLPWLSAGIGNFSTSMNGTGVAGINPLVWLIPLLAIAVIVTDFMANETASKWLSYAAGLVPLVWIILRIPLMGSGVFFATAGIGMYLTLLASILMLLGAFKIIKIG